MRVLDTSSATAVHTEPAPTTRYARSARESRPLVDRGESSMATSTERDRAFARQLPERFQRFPPSMSGVERVNELVYQGWASCPAPLRRQLAQTLLCMLTPLLTGATPDDVLRSECDDVVVRWIARR